MTTLEKTLTTTEVLKRAYERIADETKWIKGRMRDVTYRDDDSCGVCLLGAIHWASTGDPTGYHNVVGVAAIDLIRDQLGTDMFGNRPFVDEFNDDVHTVHPDVLNVLKLAIAASEAENWTQP